MSWRTSQIFSRGLKSELALSLILACFIHSINSFDVCLCLRSLSGWNTQNISLMRFIIIPPTIHQVPLAAKQSQSIMLPKPRLIVGMLFLFTSCHCSHVTKFFVSSDHITYYRKFFFVHVLKCKHWKSQGLRRGFLSSQSMAV